MDITQCDGKIFYKVKRITFSEKKFYNTIKRIFDICASAIAVLVLGIPMLVIALLVKADSIREVIAFPKNSKARDLLMNAPSKVFDKQLEEVHIKLDIENKE